MADQRILNILDAISEYREYHTSIILTYGANLAFYEQVILSRLWQANSRNNLVYMDAVRYYEAIDDYRDTIGYVGRRYLLVPIKLGIFQSFHPKLILLLGTERSRLLIGSGNLTFNGYGNNLEVFTQLDWSLKNLEYQHIFFETWKLINNIQEQWGHSDQAERMLQKAQARSEWLLEESEPSGIKLLHSFNSKIIDQIVDIVGKEQITNLTIFTPFLDNQAKAIEQFHVQLNPQKIELILQPKRAVGNPKALQELQKADLPLKILGISESERYIHAKLYLIETAQGATLATGSANCTKSALLANSQSGNLEILLLKKYGSRTEARNIIQDYYRLESLSHEDLFELRPYTPTPEKQTEYLNLLDVSLEGQSMVVKFEVFSLPENVLHLGLHISFPINLIFPIGGFDTGFNTIKLDVPDERIHTLYIGAIAASICGFDENDQIVDLNSNKLWITNTNELNRSHVFLTPTDNKAGHLLNEMELGSDEDWRDLYETVTSLVELDLGRMQLIKQGTPTGKKPPPTKTTKHQKHEDKLRIIEDDGSQNFNVSDIEEEIFRESRLHSWLEIVFAQFPGGFKTPPRSSVDPPTQRRPRRQPNPNLSRQFVSLIRRYIRSLNNPEFMRTAPSFYLLAYFSIFQRIIWLLLKHEVISKENYAKFATLIHIGLFTSPGSSLPPFLIPEYHNHMRWRYSLQWRDNLTHLYALVSLIVLKDMYRPDDLEDQKEVRIENLFIHTLACLCSIIRPIDLTDDIEGIVQVAYSYDMDEVELLEKLTRTLDKHLPEALKLLTSWRTQTILRIQDTETNDEIMLLFNAIVSLCIGSERITEYLNMLNDRVTHCAELVYWANRIEEKGLANYYQLQLVELLRQQGDLHTLAMVLLKQGKQYSREEDYEKAINLLLQAKVIARELLDENLMKIINTHLSAVRFFMK